MLNEIKQYKTNKKEIENITNSLDELREQHRKEIYKVRYDIYDKKMKVLQDERDEKINKLDEQFEKEENKKTEERERKEVIIFKVKKILEFLKISKDKRDLDFKAYSYYGYPKEKKYLKPIRTIADDEFKKIQVFIYENDKPKNKFSLCVVGMTIFNETISKFPKDYLHINKEDGYFNIEKWLKDLPTENELMIYYEKNKGKILKEFLEEHKKAEEEYLNTIKNYKLEDFKELFEVECLKCDFFLLDKRTYHLDTDDKGKLLCPKCKEVLKYDK